MLFTINASSYSVVCESEEKKSVVCQSSLFLAVDGVYLYSSECIAANLIPSIKAIDANTPLAMKPLTGNNTQIESNRTFLKFMRNFYDSDLSNDDRVREMFQAAKRPHQQSIYIIHGYALLTSNKKK